MKTTAAYSADWRSDFSRALMLSTAVIILWTGLLTAFRSHKPEVPACDDTCSITDCLISRDGSQAMVAFWQADSRRKALGHRLATIELKGPGHELMAVPPGMQPRRLAPASERSLLIVSASDSLSRCTTEGRQVVTKSTYLASGAPDYVALSVDGRLLITWDVGRLVAVDTFTKEICWQRGSSEIASAILSPAAGLFAACGNRVVELSLETGKELRLIATCSERVRQLAVDRRGKWIASLTWDGDIEVCRLQDGKSLWRQRSHAAATLPATHRPFMYSGVLNFSEDGRYLVTCAHEGEWVIAVWDAKSGARLKSLRGHDKVVNGARFLPDGTLASWASDGTLRLWNIKRGAVQRIVRAQGLLTS